MGITIWFPALGSFDKPIHDHISAGEIYQWFRNLHIVTPRKIEKIQSTSIFFIPFYYSVSSLIVTVIFVTSELCFNSLHSHSFQKKSNSP